MQRKVIDRQGSWADMRTAFHWHVPDRFNIAERCCDSWAASDPERLAIRHIGEDGTVEDWTYARLKGASDGLAQALAARGVRRGDRVAVLLPQCPAVMITHFAVQKLGAVILPLFSAFGPDALAYRLGDSGAVAVVTDRDNLSKIMEIRDDLPDLATVLSTDNAAAPILHFWDELDRYHRPLVPVDTGADDPATMIYTSGTTGQPKGVLHAHRFLIGHLPSIETTHPGFPLAGDVGWTPADWAWIGGLMDMAIPCLYFGVPLISRRMKRFDPDEAFDLIARNQVRNLFLPPTALKLMRAATVPVGVDVRSITSGGESLGADLLDWGKTALGAPINEIYGQTECNLTLASVDGAMEVRPGSMGQAVPGMDVALIDADGNPVATGETGEIAVKRGTPVMFLEYWKKPEQTAEKFAGDWMRTGDMARQDGDGYFTFVGRSDDLINSAGYRIGPTEIENCLSGHPDVVMAAAVGVPDTERGEVVKAYVVLRDGVFVDTIREDLTNLVRRRISPHVAPRQIEQRMSLPMTATGKIMRRKLRDAD